MAPAIPGTALHEFAKFSDHWRGQIGHNIPGRISGSTPGGLLLSDQGAQLFCVRRRNPAASRPGLTSGPLRTLLQILCDRLWEVFVPVRIGRSTESHWRSVRALPLL